jgi:hypothetical protein
VTNPGPIFIENRVALLILIDNPPKADNTHIGSREAAMPTYVVNVHLKGIIPLPRHSRLDELMESLGFFPRRR